ncbi:FixH family protein [Pontibaca methylaminivorans]|uniref:Nitrogen fixation protein FixH n=1 Tax=Pontibaca methylaminivorans TaxID=515897 RepID=A0A1R3WEV7_9RHOB|nr:FixH family protein [Pontibaca methylaminivorans]SIT76649.1 Nitrogen fixation protein FixH [Pontibaca methylaminivorans]
MSTTKRKGEFTGRHMLAIMVVFFGVVIAVNLTMAFMARKSWTGTVVDNTYVASQEFNTRVAEGRAQAALGWDSDLAIRDGVLTYHLTDAAGEAVITPADTATASFRHAAYEADDRSAVLVRQPDGTFSAPVDLPDGQWIVEITTEVRGLDHPYRDAQRIVMADGVMK